jgi:hypothetical protein
VKNRIYLYITALLLTFIITNPSKDDVLTQLNKHTYTEDSAKNVSKAPQYDWHDVYDNPDRANFLFFSIYHVNYYLEGTSTDSIHYPKVKKLIIQERYLGLCWKVIKL